MSKRDVIWGRKNKRRITFALVCKENRVCTETTVAEDETTSGGTWKIRVDEEFS